MASPLADLPVLSTFIRAGIVSLANTGCRVNLGINLKLRDPLT